MTVNDIAHPEYLDISPTFIKRATSGEIEHTNFEKRYFHKDGHVVWGQVSSSLVRDAQGKPQYFISHVQDITQRKKAEEALKESQRFLSNIFSGIQDGLSILDTELNILRVNPAMEQWYSHAMPLVGKKCYEAYHGRGERCDVCPTYQTINTGKAAYEIVPKTGPGGKIVGWLDLYSFPLIDAVTEKMRGVIEYVRDISDRKRAEETLKTTNERLNYLLTSTSVAIYTSKASGDYGATSITENLKQITGYEPREFIKNSSFWIDHIHPEDKQRILNEVLRILEQGSHIYEYRFLCKDSTYRWIRDEMKLVRSEDGKPLEIVGYWIDIKIGRASGRERVFTVV
jgi:PAS domain S-box-containing protein